MIWVKLLDVSPFPMSRPAIIIAMIHKMIHNG